MIRPRLTYANVTATLALFIALGGTSYAVTKLPKGSVGSDQLRASAVTNSKIASGAVTADKVAKGAVTADKLAPGVAVSGPRGPRGEQGPAGSSGAAGASGGAAGNAVYATGANRSLKPAAGASDTLVDTLLDAGTWNLDGQVRVDYEPSAASLMYVNCDLRDDNDKVLVRSTARLGSAAGLSATDMLPLVGVVRLTTSTRISIVCTHDNEAEAGHLFTAQQIVLRATRTAGLDVR